MKDCSLCACHGNIVRTVQGVEGPHSKGMFSNLDVCVCSYVHCRCFNRRLSIGACQANWISWVTREQSIGYMKESWTKLHAVSHALNTLETGSQIVLFPKVNRGAEVSSLDIHTQSCTQCITTWSQSSYLTGLVQQNLPAALYAND
jgi:hypothetical protein